MNVIHVFLSSIKLFFWKLPLLFILDCVLKIFLDSISNRIQELYEVFIIYFFSCLCSFFSFTDCFELCTFWISFIEYLLVLMSVLAMSSSSYSSFKQQFNNFSFSNLELVKWSKCTKIYGFVFCFTTLYNGWKY